MQHKKVYSISYATVFFALFLNTAPGIAVGIECPKQWYSPVGGANATSDCIMCPYYATSNPGSTKESDCFCMPGGTREVGICDSCFGCWQCARGKYKWDPGDAPCDDCPAGTWLNREGVNTPSSCWKCPPNTYSTSLGAVVQSVCISCPANSASPLASDEQTDCKCNTGWTGVDGGTCVALALCVAGKYKTSTGSAACTDCVAGKYSTAVGADVCQTCLSNSVSAISSDDLTDCMCNIGWTGSGGGTPCSACIAGTYKDSIGSDACEKCIAGTYSTTSSAVTAEACLSCPSNSDSAEASESPADCICNAGFSGVRGELCTQCAVGKFRAAPSGI